MYINLAEDFTGITLTQRLSKEFDMANLLPQPKGLAGWKAYANSEDVTSIPLREAHDANKTLVSELFL